jgi:hypothetical protein
VVTHIDRFLQLIFVARKRAFPAMEELAHASDATTDLAVGHLPCRVPLDRRI